MKVLIITNMDLRRRRRKYTANLGLIWGLKARNIAWRALSPKSHRPQIDDGDAVLSWWSRPEKSPYQWQFWHPLYGEPTPGPEHRFAFEAQLSHRCRELGMPLINALGQRRRLRYSDDLQTWREQGIACPPGQKIEGPEDIAFKTPVALCTNGLHLARNLFLAKTRQQITEHFDACAAEDRRVPNLALDVIDTPDPDGLYRRRRCLVVGDQVIPRQQLVSENWHVNLETARCDAQAVSEDRQFMADGEPRADLVRQAAQVLGLEISAVDYTRRPDGSYFFWRANAVFDMPGLGNDEESERFQAATGRNKDDCREEHVRLGKAVADLIRQRVADSHG